MMKTVSEPFKNVLNFFLYDSLKITLDDYSDDNDICLARVIDKAYQDATMQSAFNALVFKEKKDEEKEELERSVKAGKKNLQNLL